MHMSTLIPGEQRRAVLIDGEPVKDVDKLMCLGSMFVANGQATEEIRTSINLARSAFSLWSWLDSCQWPDVASTSGRPTDADGL